jgi:hypothetical protein
MLRALIPELLWLDRVGIGGGGSVMVWRALWAVVVLPVFVDLLLTVIW